MENYKMKVVFFDKYCKNCKHNDIPQDADPCNECLTIAGREFSHKPEYFEEKNKK